MSRGIHFVFFSIQFFFASLSHSRFSSSTLSLPMFFHRARLYRFPSKMTFDFFSQCVFEFTSRLPLCNSTVICRSVRLLKMRMAFIICVCGSVSRRWLYEVTVRLQPYTIPSLFATYTNTIRESHALVGLKRVHSLSQTIAIHAVVGASASASC